MQYVVLQIRSFGMPKKIPIIFPHDVSAELVTLALATMLGDQYIDAVSGGFIDMVVSTVHGSVSELDLVADPDDKFMIDNWNHYGGL